MEVVRPKIIMKKYPPDKMRNITKNVIVGVENMKFFYD